MSSLDNFEELIILTKMGEEEIIIFFILFLIGILLFHSMKKLSYFMLYSIKVNELKGLK